LSSGMNYQLLRAYPNPFNAQTSISVELARAGFLSVEVYDILGRRVSTLFSGNAPETRMTLPMNAESWSSGVYFVSLKTSTEQSILRVFLQK